ncbi:MAG: hypothetical protein IPI15_01815 [Saprospiraceae bacterium]|jgi:hypothetical protein|uniref:hypothetical protein n=1 Tax=Candidatus Brachybacter algidus TaxID=2982024 RepID=UPI0025807868|nr:hypothetical protein [Candidatus Brachybacter algidus]MBK7602321.1 hypothetical protein [Candidatus Brachybacter algidus]
MKYFIFIIIIFYLSTSVPAQGIHIESIIHTADADSKLLVNQRTTEFINQQNFSLPLIREAEIRLGINGNATPNQLDGYLRNEDYYAIKISPNSLRERKYQRALKPAQADLYKSNDHMFMQEAIFERYQSIVKLYYAEIFIKEKSKLQPFLVKKSALLNEMLDQGLDIKFKDVVDVEYDKNDLLSSLFEYSNIVNEEHERIKGFLNVSDSIFVDFDHFISSDEIRTIILTVDTSNVVLSPEVIYTKYKAQLSMAELNYQKSRNKQIFSFFQAGYSPVVVSEEAKTKFNPSNDLTFRFGVNVPIGANNNLRRSEAAIKLYEDKNDAQLTREKYKADIMLQRTKILQLIDAKDQWQKMFDNNLILKLLKNESLKDQITPLEIMDMEISVIKLRLQGLKLDDKIANEYIELMSIIGALNDTARNYLTRD